MTSLESASQAALAARIAPLSNRGLSFRGGVFVTVAPEFVMRDA